MLSVTLEIHRRVWGEHQKSSSSFWEMLRGRKSFTGEEKMSLELWKPLGVAPVEEKGWTRTFLAEDPAHVQSYRCENIECVWRTANRPQRLGKSVQGWKGSRGCWKFYRANGVPPKDTLNSSPLVLVNGTLFGHRVLVDVIRLRWGH